jgi:hypothetical protein
VDPEKNPHIFVDDIADLVEIQPVPKPSEVQEVLPESDGE